MIISRSWVVLMRAAVCVSSLIASTSAFAQDPCALSLDRFNETIRRGVLEAAAAAADSIVGSLDCPADARFRVGRLAALAHVAEAQWLGKNGASVDVRLRVLEAGRRFGQPWQLLALIGDELQEMKGPNGKSDYAAASLSYQAALSAISDPANTPVPPSRSEIERLMRLAAQTRALAAQFVSGQELIKRDVRGVAVEAVPVPVQYAFDKAEMTSLGRKYAEETARLLNGLQRPSILLVGHTDPVGSDLYNMELSLRRAEALKQYLVASGYEPRSIGVKGLGKRAPLEIEGKDNYTSEQIHQMLRRVEICFMDQGNSSANCN